MKGLITRFFTNLGRNGGWKNPRTSAWSRNLIDRVLIHEQLGISNEGVVDVINTTFDETKNCFEEDCRSTCLCGK
jgi:hypothetical protein